jgi:hypothetical protein
MVSDAEQLATWRTIGARYSEQVLDLAPRVLKSGGLGEQGKLPGTNTCGKADIQNGESENNRLSQPWIWDVYPLRR